jgi:hypothetical protein
MPSPQSLGAAAAHHMRRPLPVVFGVQYSVSSRVPVQTRDLLAAQARERGISIAALLTELAARSEHAALQAVRDENRDWQATVGGGLA